MRRASWSGFGNPELNDLFAMEIELQSEAIADPESLAGWPFGLPTCIAIHTPSPKFERRLAQTSAHTPALAPALAFHQQFMNLQTTFLLPFFSDGDGGSSSATDSDTRSEAASSFFKDSRRITLGSLIGLPMDNSFHAIHPDAHYHVFGTARRSGRTSLTFLPSCGIRELLRCVRINNSGGSLHEFAVSEDDGDHDDDVPVGARSDSLAAYLQLEAAGVNNIPSSVDAANCLDALSNGSHSPDWNGQFVSCHSVLSDGEWTGAITGRVPSPKLSTPRVQKSQKMQRSASMKSFFSSICCRIDAVKRP